MDNIIKSEEIEGVKLFLEGRLKELEENLDSKEFPKYQSNYKNAYEVNKGLIPKDDLEAFDKKYEELMKIRGDFVKSLRK